MKILSGFWWIPWICYFIPFTGRVHAHISSAPSSAYNVIFLMHSLNIFCWLDTVSDIWDSDHSIPGDKMATDGTTWEGGTVTSGVYSISLSFKWLKNKEASKMSFTSIHPYVIHCDTRFWLLNINFYSCTTATP